MTEYRKRTRAVHAGSRRSQYGEVSEAIFMTQGFVYETAEAAEEKPRLDGKPRRRRRGFGV